MARKVVRDIQKQGLLTITLEKEEAASGPLRIKDGMVDCSAILQKRRPVIHRAKESVIRDVKGDQKEGRVLFMHIDEMADVREQRKNEVLRLAASGVLIFLLVNIFNVYYRGMSVKDGVMASAYSGYENLVSGAGEASNLNFAAAQGEFAEAKNNFDIAEEMVFFLHTNEDYFFVKDRTVESVQGLLEAAKDIASAGDNFAKGVEHLALVPELFVRENLYPEDNAAGGKASLTEQLKGDLMYLETATDQIENAAKNLNRVSPDVLPPTFRERLMLAREKVNAINEILQSAKEKIPALLMLLGDKYPHRYLILLQNDAEARPTGGFIGSYLIVDTNDGYITKMEFHDVYELDGQLQEDIEPPPDIARVSNNWRMRDSNYSPDFAVSAEKTAWFLQKQKGPSVDTVIAVNQSFIGDLLKITGPLQVSGLKEALTADNFQLVLSYIIELKLSGDDNPKKIMQELIPAFQKKIFAGGVQVETLVKAIIRGYREKKIMLYSRHAEIESVFEEMGMDGKIASMYPGDDFLAVTAVSIGGNKSDRFMEQKIRHYTLIDEDGSMADEVTIVRKHTWTEKDLEGWRAELGTFGFGDLPDHIIDILGRARNKSFIKIYVPAGSELLEVGGIERSEVQTFMDETLNKTYFMFEMDVSSGSEKRVSVSYRLPEQLRFYPADTYRIHIHKQPAINDSQIEKKVFLKPMVKVASQYPDGFFMAEDESITYDGMMDKDLYLSALVGIR